METVIWVNKLGDCGLGTFDNPFCEIADAVNSVVDNDPRLIRVLPSATYLSAITVPSGRTLAIRSSSDDLITHAVSNMNSIEISANAQVYIDSLVILGDNKEAVGILCNNAKLWLDRSTITGKNGLGIDSSGCELQLARTQLTGNNGGGIQANDGSLQLENSILGGNGGGVVGGIKLTGDASLNATYTTIAFNFAFAPDAIECEDGTMGGTISNSIVFGFEDPISVVCPNLQVTTSAVDSENLNSDGNTLFPNLDPLWFVDTFGSKDFHLAGDGADFKGIAVWSDGDPPYDIDGDDRPDIDGALDFAGADVPVP
jgi:hypothetical protein